MSPNLRELLLIGGAYIVSPASAPDLAGDVLEAVSLPAGDSMILFTNGPFVGMGIRTNGCTPVEG